MNIINVLAKGFLPSFEIITHNLVLSSCKLFYIPLKSKADNLGFKFSSPTRKNAYVVNEWVPQGPSSNHTSIGILSWCAISNVVKETHCLL